MENTIRLTVDPIITTNEGEVILVKRVFDPYKDYWALPGGFVEYGETVECAAIRGAKEETGLDIKLEKLAGVYSGLNRDPRGHSISVCFLCKTVGGELKTSEETKAAKALSKNELKTMRLAFDNEEILKDIGFIE